MAKPAARPKREPPPAQPAGEVITFYSYKGGTGRTMAAANIGCALAQDYAARHPNATSQAKGSSAGVLLIDWDLEAPGMHRYFQSRLVQPQDLDRPGLIDLLSRIEMSIPKGLPATEEDGLARSRSALKKVNLGNYLLPTTVPGLHLMPAGRMSRLDNAYSRRVNTFPWEDLFHRCPALFPEFARLLASRYRYILIDSRTGLTDSAGICTMLMPEKLVVVFTPSSQSLMGIEDLVVRATTYRRKSNDMRPLLVFPLPSRVEPSREDLRSHWRFGNQEKGITGYQPMFEKLLARVYDVEGCTLDQYFGEVQIQQSADYAYGEEIAVLNEGKDDRFSMSRSYRTFAERLTSPNPPWERPQVEAPGPRPFCFVVTPFGTKRDAAGQSIDFERVFRELIAPAIRDAGLEPIRADTDTLVFNLSRPIFEKLILSEVAIFDLTTGNPNVLYELGIRHGLRPHATILLTEQSGQIPLDLAAKFTLSYPAARPQEAKDRLTARLLGRLHPDRVIPASLAFDSPVYQLIEGIKPPELGSIETGVFRERTASEALVREEIEAARQKGLPAIQQMEKHMGPIGDLDAGLAIQLLLAYRSAGSWRDMIRLVETFSTLLTENPMVQQQLALALIRMGDHARAIETLTGLQQRYGSSSETLALLGRVYKDRWDIEHGDKLLLKAVEAYLAAFEMDWRDAYSGVNAVTLMELSDPPDPRRVELLPVVDYAVRRSTTGQTPEYWDYAAPLELALVANGANKARELLPKAIEAATERWQVETTFRNMERLRNARRNRDDSTALIDQILAELKPQLAQVAETQSSAREELLKLAKDYEEIRRSMPSGWERTSRMTAVFSTMTSIAPLVQGMLDEFEKSDSPGVRLAAIAVLQMFPEAAHLNWLAQRLDNPKVEAPFVGYQAAVALVEAVRVLPATECGNLKWALSKAKSLAQRLPSDLDRLHVLAAGERELSRKCPSSPDTATEPAKIVANTEEDVTELVQKEIRKLGSEIPISANLLIFSTRKQQTWLSFSPAGVFCTLDNRPKGGKIRVRWREPLAGIDPGSVSVRDRKGRPGLLRMGSQHDWLYSQALFGTGELLKKRVLEEVQRARDKEKSST